MKHLKQVYKQCIIISSFCIAISCNTKTTMGPNEIKFKNIPNTINKYKGVNEYYINSNRSHKEASGNLTRSDVMTILGDLKSRNDWNIVGEVFLIDIEISKKEKEDIEKWWIEKYKKLGTYSVIPLFGEQCTTNVRLSLSKCTDVINDFTLKVQTPQGLYDLLTNSAKHTYGKKTNEQLTITKKYSEI